MTEVSWGLLPDEAVCNIARAVNGSDAIRWCAVNKAFHDLQPKLEVLVLGGYSHPGDLLTRVRVAVEDGGTGLTVRLRDGVRGLRIIEMLGVRYGAQLQRLYVALPAEAVRTDPVGGAQLGCTLTDLRELYWLHRQPGSQDDAGDAAWPILEALQGAQSDGGERAESVAQLIISVRKTLEVLEIRCCVFVHMWHFYPLYQELRRAMRRIVVDLTPFRSSEIVEFPPSRSHNPFACHPLARSQIGWKPSYAEHRARL
jgi:hypothetical protein